MDTGHWIFFEEFNEEEWFGFIYKIYELDTGREYIGKKQFTKIRRKVIAGRKNRKVIKSQSDWKTYTGSSIELNEQIKLKGLDNYKFEILSLHTSKGSLHYAEVRTQITEDVLRTKMENGQRKYFNKVINGVKFLPPEERTEESKMKQSATMKAKFKDKSKIWWYKMSPEQQQEYVNTYKKGEKNPMYGAEPFNKGCTFEETYGEEKAKDIKLKLSEVNKGKPGTFLGKTHTEETRTKISNSNKGKATGEKNAMFGIPCYYKMSEEELASWKENISKAGKGRKFSEEHKSKIGAAHKGKQKIESTCPHCNKTGRGGNMKRYHFDNCKLK
jgi:Putative endonuclease segE, GIY-YIG domain/NUMOD3 motif